MKAIILAGGQGTRLKKYTKDIPKGMLDVDGRTILERQIYLYKKLKFEKIIIIRGFAKDKINYDGVTYYDVPDFKETNMVEGMMRAKNEFDSDIVVSYSDILFSEEMLKTMMNNKNDFAVAVDIEWKKYWKMRYGRIDFDVESLKIDSLSNIISLGIPDVKLDEIDARYIGLIKFSKKGIILAKDIFEKDFEEYKDKPWKQSGKNIRQSYFTDLLQALIDDKQEVKAVPFKNNWIEFDTNEDYETAIKWIKSGEIRQIGNFLYNF